MRGSPGIYVEIKMQTDLDSIWRLTQDPALHQRWDLRFSEITYLPRASSDEPQRFLYKTRIGFGLSITGTGASVGERIAGDATSSLKFASADPKSMIRAGSGYWCYVPTPHGLRFFTWYDYSVRFGALGRALDFLFFRPLMGWATAYSFDRLRLWIEDSQTPEVSLRLALIHATARVATATVWIWHGLVPKLMFHDRDEQAMLTQAGASLRFLPWIGAAEISIGVLMLLTWRWRGVFLANMALMLAATIAVAVNSTHYFKGAFNPATLNLSVIALAVVGWLASENLPSARKCLRVAPKERA